MILPAQSLIQEALSLFDAVNIAILIGAALVAISTLTSLVSKRFGTPLLLLFLGIGLLAGEDGLLGISFDNNLTAYFIGSLALAIILFDSGFETKLRSYRTAAAPALILATLGVVLTAGFVGAAAHYLFGLGWIQSFLLGSIVASTDAAAVFFLLRVGGIRLRDKVGSTLEIESGANDPMAIFLTMIFVELAIAESIAPAGLGLELALGFFQQMGLGLAFGFVGGFGIAFLLNKLRNLDPGLYPISGLAAALVVYAACALMGGSGFLAAYVAGLIAGNRKVRFAQRLRRFQVGMTWLAQIGMFLTLGLLATPSEFGAIIIPAVILAFVLIFLARPIAVLLCLAPFSFRSREKLFIGWVGLRGAVSILLALLPAISGMDSSNIYFNVVFVMVLASLLIQGWTIQPAAKALNVALPPEPGLVDRVEIELRGGSEFELVGYRIHPESAIAKGARVPRWARPAMIIRGGQTHSFHTIGALQANDQVYLFASPGRLRLLDRIYTNPADSLASPADVQFHVKGQAPLSELIRQYRLPIEESDTDISVGEFLYKAFDGGPVEGDRLSYAEIDLVVAGLDEAGKVTRVGLAVHEPDAGARQVVMDLILKGWRRVRRGFGQGRAADRDAGDQSASEN